MIHITTYSDIELVLKIDILCVKHMILIIFFNEMIIA